MAATVGSRAAMEDHGTATWTISFDKIAAQESPLFIGADSSKPWQSFEALSQFRPSFVRSGTRNLGPFLRLCERLNAKPVVEISAGNGDCVQQALNMLEYANGDARTQWGAVRARQGHPAPYHVELVELTGNTNAEQYRTLYDALREALDARHAGLTLIAGRPVPGSFAPMVEQRYSGSPRWFIQHADLFDSYSRSGPQVYVADYSTGGSGGDLAEAAFLLGMERNSDVVTMTSQPSDDDGQLSHSAQVRRMFGQSRCDFILRSHLVGDRPVETRFPAGGFGFENAGSDVDVKDVRVTSGSKTLFRSADGNRFSAPAEADSSRESWPADASWSNYTIHLKIRERSGENGFGIVAGRAGGDNKITFRLGAEGDTEAGFDRLDEGDESHQRVPNSLELGRWYDVRVDYSPNRIAGYVDGDLVIEASPPEEHKLYVLAGRAGKDLILKVVNLGEDRKLHVVLTGYPWRGAKMADKQVLGATTTPDLETVGRDFTASFPAQSMTILRLSPVPNRPNER
jgi:hypothetical protein